jgi:hypothetical protein
MQVTVASIVKERFVSSRESELAMSAARSTGYDRSAACKEEESIAVSTMDALKNTRKF